MCCHPHSMLVPTVLQEGTGASVGTGQGAGQEAQEGECKGHPGVQGRLASPCGCPGEPVQVVTGLLWVPGVEQKIFMQESDASNFLKKRGKRSPKSQDEVNGKDADDLLLLAPLVPLAPGQLDCGDLAPWASKGLQLLVRNPTSPGLQVTAVSIDCCHGMKQRYDEIHPKSRKLETYKGKIYILVGTDTGSQCVLFGILKSEPLYARAIAFRAGRGHMVLQARIVGLVTALLLSGLGHFLSQGPSFLIYKPLKVWCSASSGFFFF